MKVFTITTGDRCGWSVWTRDPADYILNQIVTDQNRWSESNQANTQEVSVGDVVVIHSRGHYRTAIVNHVARTKITAGFTTQGAIDEMQRKIADPKFTRFQDKLVQDGGSHHPNVTNKSTNEFWLI